MDTQQWSINKWSETLQACSDNTLIVVWAITRSILKQRGYRLRSGVWVEPAPAADAVGLSSESPIVSTRA